MRMIRCEPFRELMSLPQTMDRLFETSLKGEAKAEEEARLKGQRLRQLWPRDLGEVGFESLLKPACVTRSM